MVTPRKRFFLFSPLLLLLLVPILSRKKLTLLPNESLQCYSFTDAGELEDSSKASIVDSFILNDSSLTLGFTLSNGYDYPYAGVGFSPNAAKALDLTPYNEIELHLTSENMRHVKLQLTSSESHIPPRIRQYELTLTPGTERYRVPLNQLTTPLWWYTINNLSPEQVHPTKDLLTIETISVDNSSFSEVGIPYSMTISEISFQQNYRYFYWVGALWIVVVFLYIKHQKRSGSEEKERKYQQVVMSDPDKKIFQQLTDSIGENFSNPDYSIIQISDELSLSTKRIAKLFREQSHGTFKQYLNGIRLTEAHRLLLEENSQVTQILFAVGFNSPSHFNRLFSDKYGISPSELRKQNS